MARWSRWSEAASRRPWTVGVEEELMLLRPAGWGLANRIDDVLLGLHGHGAAETHASVVELATAPCATVAGVADELARRRGELAGVLRQLGLRAGAAGTHPLADGSDVAVSAGARYEEIASTTRALAHREPTFALHIHVAVPNGELAVRALDGMRGDLPLLLALAANSPFLHGADSGFASMRVPTFSMFPRTGTARAFGTYRGYVRAVNALLNCGAIPEPGFLWWDARLQPALGTVEVRIMDAQARVADVAALAALVQSLVRRLATGPPRRPPPEAELLAENRFLAARDGMEAELIEPDGRRRPAAAALARLVDECRPFAHALGCPAELASVAELAADPGYARQRRLASRHGIAAVPAFLAEELTIPTPGLAAA
jgi:glutamate---cysteine ligase / carboxylate-amine ligase